jgi:hypothetical protein
LGKDSVGAAVLEGDEVRTELRHVDVSRWIAAARRKHDNDAHTILPFFIESRVLIDEMRLDGMK